MPKFHTLAENNWSFPSLSDIVHYRKMLVLYKQTTTYPPPLVAMGIFLDIYVLDNLFTNTMVSYFQKCSNPKIFTNTHQIAFIFGCKASYLQMTVLHVYISRKIQNKEDHTLYTATGPNWAAQMDPALATISQHKEVQSSYYQTASSTITIHN